MLMFIDYSKACRSFFGTLFLFCFAFSPLPNSLFEHHHNAKRKLYSFAKNKIKHESSTI